MVTFNQYKEHKDKALFLLIDRVTKSNIDVVKQYVQSATLLIDTKLSMPTPEDLDKQNKNGGKAEYIENGLADLRTSVLNNSNNILNNETSYNNFRAKAIYWETKIIKELLEKKSEDSLIVVCYTPSKHEIQFYKLLYQIGISIVIISKDASTFDISDMPNGNSILQYMSKQGDEEQTIDIIQYYNNVHADTQVILNELSDNKTDIEVSNMSAVPKSTEEIEQAIFEENRQLRVNVSGIVNYIDACNFYGHAYAECKKYPERYMLIQYEFPVATVDQIREIPRFANLKYNYLIETLPNFIKCNNESLKEQLKIGFKQAFCDEEYKTMNESVLYNKMVKLLGIINNVVRANIKYVIYYGKMNDTDKKIMSILKEVSSLGILIMCPDKSVNNNIVGIDTLELPNSTEMFDMPTMDKRSKATTIAAAVQGKVNNTLYSGDVLGMYKPGQFRFAKSIPFVTTYDEIEMWWNKPLYLRPGFSANGDTATMPTMFKIIKGVHRDTNWYISSIRKLCCGKTIAATSEHDLCVGFINRNTHVMVSHGVDVNGTLYREQVPLYNSKYELNIKNIKQDKNYQYNILANNKQDMILSTINEIISSETIAWQKDFKTKEEFVTLVLNLLLNLSYTVLDMLQWFEYYTYNPNLILYLNTNSVINTQSAVIIEFARLMGFDIAIFIPNGYMLIEQKIQKDVYMDIYTIGETSSQINIGRLEVTSNIEIQSSNNQSKEKKKSLFSKLFG